MKKSLFNVNLFILLLAIALSLSSGDRSCAAQENGSANKGTLYFFTNEGCRPCKQIEPMLRDLAVSGYPITKVDTAAYPQWVQRFQISSTPTLVLLQGKRVVKRHSGFVDATTVKNWFHSIGVTNKNNNPGTKTSSNGQPVIPSNNRDAFLIAFDNKRNADTLAGDSSTLHKGTPTPGTSSEKAAMDATVRIRVEDPEGISYATGTIIHCRQGEWLVMTCGHVFRDSGGQGDVSVEYGFADGSPVRAPAQLMKYDANSRDIGLISVQAGVNVSPIKLAERSTTVQRGKQVFSIGCDHGEPPTIRRTKIKRTAEYFDDKIIKYDIYGRPVDGRSGGGLFTSDGELIGICNAATVDFDEGIYTALDTIYWQIAQVRLDHLFQPGQQSELAGNNATSPDNRGIRGNARIPSTLTGATRLQDKLAQAYQKSESPLATPFQNRSSGGQRPDRFADSRNPINGVAWNQNQQQPRVKNKSNEMEVILIVRSKADPTRTEAITLSDPSPQLLNYLEKIGNRQSGESRIDMAQLRRQMDR